MTSLMRYVFLGPMALAILGSLVVAPALTLVFVPALYSAWFAVRREEIASTTTLSQGD
jgi:multidrug efflux pump subunit AcrB